MPELPEVEVLVRHLAPLLTGRRIGAVEVRRAKVIAPDTPVTFRQRLVGARFTGIRRRGKYLVFTLRSRCPPRDRELVGHLGMTGRMYLQPAGAEPPRHATVLLGVGPETFVFEDPRGFGRLSFDTTALERLGPEPLDTSFTVEVLAAALRRSRQPIKARLLDQALVAGIGNIYASEALFHAGISPRVAAHRLTLRQVAALWDAIRTVLSRAIRFGSTVSLSWSGEPGADRLFYYGRAKEAPGCYEERLAVYDRAGEPCRRCGTAIRRITQLGRSTYFCPACQRPRAAARTQLPN